VKKGRDKQQRRRHCMVVHAYYPLGETRVERQAKALARHGMEVDVICLRYEGEPEVDSEDGINIYRLPVKRHKNSGLAMQLLEYLAFFTLVLMRLAVLHRRRRYRVIQIHNLPDFLVFAGLVPKLTGARLILDLHDLMPEFYAARFSSGLKSWPVRLLQWQEQLCCRYADHVITVTELWRERLIERGLPPEKVTVVMNVADDRIFQPGKTTEMSTGADRPFNLIYHGILTQRYGIDVAIRAVDIVRERIPQVHLTIHGAGEYQETLMKLTDELGLGQHVSFSTRFMPTSELPQFIAKADIGLVPYRCDVFTDGILPTKLMEYVALGRPVIAARTRAIATYFDDTMVQFFTPGDSYDLARCILALYTDRHRLAQLAENAGTFNQQYNWTKIGAQYVALVDRLSTR
jgi:glycosyltransferase involved in cell wall biosynthesis